MALKDKLIIAAPTARKVGPWAGMIILSAVALNDLRVARKN